MALEQGVAATDTGAGTAGGSETRVRSLPACVCASLLCVPSTKSAR